MTELVDNVRHIITKQIMNGEHVNVDSVCRELGKTRHHVMRMYRMGSGETVGYAITDRRMRLARVLLGAGWAVEATGVECGYSCVQSFTRAFRHHLGQTPRQWIKENYARRIG